MEAFDNSGIEFFYVTLKKEEFYLQNYKAQLTLFEYIESWYNTLVKEFISDGYVILQET